MMKKYWSLSLGIAIGSVIVDLVKGSREVGEIALKAVAMFVITLLLYVGLHQVKTNRASEEKE